MSAFKSAAKLGEDAAKARAVAARAFRKNSIRGKLPMHGPTRTHMSPGMFGPTRANMSPGMFGPTRADIPSPANRLSRMFPKGSRRRQAAYGVGGAMGASGVMNAVLRPKPATSGTSGLRPGGSQLPY